MKMEKQELVDRLVTAVGEGDVLYTLYWIKEMEQLGLVKEYLHAEHSWKHHTVFVEAVSYPVDPFRKLILDILLHHVGEPRLLDARGVAQRLEQHWASEVIKNWTIGGKEKAIDAAYLLSVELDKIGEWIDGNLPAHPRWEQMTGYGPLPPRPLPPPAPAPPSLPAAILEPTSHPYNSFSQPFPYLPYRPPPPPIELSALPDRSSQAKSIAFSLANLPTEITLEEVFSLFRTAQVEPAYAVLKQKTQSNRMYSVGNLSSGADFARAAHVLHGLNFRGRNIYLNRFPPDEHNHSHPFVLLANLPNTLDEAEAISIAHRSGVGAYGVGVAPDPRAGGARCMAWFRVETEELAVMAGQRPQGSSREQTRMTVGWLPSSSVPPSGIPPFLAFPPLPFPSHNFSPIPPPSQPSPHVGPSFSLPIRHEHSPPFSSNSTPLNQSFPPGPQGAAVFSPLPAITQPPIRRLPLPPPPRPVPAAAAAVIAGEIIDLTDDSPPASPVATASRSSHPPPVDGVHLPSPAPTETTSLLSGRNVPRGKKRKSGGLESQAESFKRAAPGVGGRQEGS